MTMSRNALQFCAALGALLYGTAASAQGLLTEHRLAAGLANEAVAEAVAACAKNGYTVTAIVVDIDGVRQAVLRGDGGEREKALHERLEALLATLLQQELKTAGFQVRAGVADIPTAFVATYGSGKPVIGIIGEFDRRAVHGE